MTTLRNRWIVAIVAAGLLTIGCRGDSSEEGGDAETAAASAAVATARGEPRDACALILREEVSAIVGEPVIARAEAARVNQTTCVYENPDSKRAWFGITVTWNGGREQWETMRAGTALAVDIMNEEFADEDVNVDSIVRPGPIAGLGDAAVFSDLMPSAILKGDTLIEMVVAFLPDPDRHFVPLGQRALERL